MKKVLIISLVLFGFFNLKAQEDYQIHKGFYLSMGLGPVFGSVTDEFSNNKFVFSGVGALFDFKIGGAIKENVLLHGTFLSNGLPGPTVESSSGSSKIPNNVSVGEAMIGAGLTYYVMPYNLLLSGSIGLGNFSINDTDNSKNNVSTQYGFSMQLKVGKEWWVSKKWGLGIAFTYGKTNLMNKSGGISEKLDSNRFGILFNATLN